MAYNVIVLGLGAMGSAALQTLAARGVRVLGLDQFAPPHDRGSSHGETRMIRQAYWESPEYIPLVLRAYELWEKLEREAEVKLLTITGGLVLGSRESQLVRGAIIAGEAHKVPCSLWSAQEARTRFPAITPLEDDVAVYEERAGYLFPEECIRAQLKMATRDGAEIRTGAKVVEWTARAGHVEVRTQDATFHAERLIITAGPWAKELFGKLFPLRVTRQVMTWIQPRGGVEDFLPGRFPVFLCDGLEGGVPGYGFPAVDGAAGGVKAAIHGSNIDCTPDTIDRVIHEVDGAEVIRQMRPRFPALDGAILKAQTCMYTMTPDEHFIVGHHPEHASVSIACGFSGHGFKFAPVIGEILADLTTTGSTSHRISIFSPLRFLRA